MTSKRQAEHMAKGKTQLHEGEEPTNAKKTHDGIQ